MAIEPDDEPNDPVLARAAQELRDEEVPSWVEASAAILEALRKTARRTRALDATYPGPEVQGDILRIADHVVALAVARALEDVAGAVRSVDLVVDGRVCSGASVDMAVTYGEDMGDLATAVSARAAQALAETLGIDVTADDVTVHVVDVLIP